MELQKITHKLSVCKVRTLSEIDLDADFFFVGKTDEDHQIGQLPYIVLSHRYGWHQYSQNIDYQ